MDGWAHHHSHKSYAAGENWAWTFQSLEALEWEMFNFYNSSEDQEIFYLGHLNPQTFSLQSTVRWLVSQCLCPVSDVEAGRRHVFVKILNVYSIYVILNIHLGLYAVRSRVRCSSFLSIYWIHQIPKSSGLTWQLRNHCFLLCIHWPQTDLQLFIVFCFVVWFMTIN